MATVEERISGLKKKYGSVSRAKNKLMSRKLDILENADDDLINEINKTQKSLYSSVKKVLSGFPVKDGKINAKDESTQKVLLLLNRELLQVVKNSTIDSKTASYLRNFDEVETLAKQLIELENIKAGVDAFSRLNLSAEKKVAIEQITEGLLTERAKRTNIRNPIKKILFRHASVGSDIKDAEDELRTFIKGQPDRYGFLERHVRVMTMDALNQYDGIINQKAFEEFEMNAFRYVGSLIKTSRPQCIRWVNRKDGIILKEQLADEIAWAKTNGSGYSTLTPINESNFSVIRGGHNCRHTAVPTIVLPDEIDQYK